MRESVGMEVPGAVKKTLLPGIPSELSPLGECRGSSYASSGAGFKWPMKIILYRHRTNL